MPKKQHKDSFFDRYFLLIWGGAFCSGGLLLFWLLGVQDFLKERQYQNESLVAEAVVLKKELKKAGSSSSTQYRLTYRFNPGLQLPIEASASVSPSSWDELQVVSRIQVRYLPQDPDSNRLLGQNNWSSALIGLALGGVFVLVGGIVFNIGLRKLRVPRQALSGEVASQKKAAPLPRFLTLAGKKVSSFSNTLNFGIVFGGIFLIFGSPFLLVGIYSAYQEHLFRQEGQHTQGMVIRKIYSSSVRGGVSRRVTYRFTTPQGQRIEGISRSGYGWDTLQERGPIEILYLSRNPGANRIAGETDWLTIAIFLALGGVFVPIGGSVLFFSLRKKLIGQNLTQKGLMTAGIVVSVENEGVGQSVIHYQYYDQMGHVRRGRSEYLSEEEAASWKVGDTGSVRFNPQRPQRSSWIGK